MRAPWAPILILALTGCAVTPGGLAADKPPFKSYTSARSPVEIAQCLKGKNRFFDVTPNDQTWTVAIKMPTYGGILISWYITPDGTGSKIDVRKANITRASAYEPYAASCF